MFGCCVELDIYAAEGVLEAVMQRRRELPFQFGPVNYRVFRVVLLLLLSDRLLLDNVEVDVSEGVRLARLGYAELCLTYDIKLVQ